MVEEMSRKMKTEREREREMSGKGEGIATGKMRKKGVAHND